MLSTASLYAQAVSAEFAQFLAQQEAKRAEEHAVNVALFALAVLFTAIVCGGLGYLAAAPRDAGFAGFWLGLLFGPLGVIASLGLDGRAQCPACKGRRDGDGIVCQWCGSGPGATFAKPAADTQPARAIFRGAPPAPPARIPPLK